MRRLACLHLFHEPCVTQWLRRCVSCPLCKLKLLGATGGQRMGGGWAEEEEEEGEEGVDN